ncbi:MAG TPA: hypothetical protein EYN66_17440 [Myxococcales bacterium]|nr:hypothetical protein [Myxococcales bacterium]
MIKTYTHYGYSYHHAGTAPTTLTTSYQAFPVTADTTNSPRSLVFPDDCSLVTVEFEVTAKSTAVSITMYLARDSAGVVPFTPHTTSGATQTISIGSTPSKGSALFGIDDDFHYDGSVANTTSGTLYVIAKADAGTPTANIRVSWRS